MSDATEPLPAPPRRRLRFSLASLLWAVVVVSLLLTTILMGVRLRRAEREVERYRSELGQLTIRDPAKPHAIGVRTHESKAYCWRIYLPPGQKYRCCEANHNIPTTGFPGGMSWAEVPNGESTIFAGAKRRADGASHTYVQSTNWETTSELQDDWVKDGRHCSIPDCVGPQQTICFEAGQPIVLLRLQAADAKSPREIAIPGSYNGLMVWLEPLPADGGRPQFTTTWSATPAP